MKMLVISGIIYFLSPVVALRSIFSQRMRFAAKLSADTGSNINNSKSPKLIFSEWDSYMHNSLSIASEELTFFDIPALHREAHGAITPNSTFTFRLQSFSTQKIRYARTVTFIGKGFNVYNLLILPRADIDLPMFGVCSSSPLNIKVLCL